MVYSRDLPNYKNDVITTWNFQVEGDAYLICITRDLRKKILFTLSLLRAVL
jgi:hypothetical protein